MKKKKLPNPEDDMKIYKTEIPEKLRKIEYMKQKPPKITKTTEIYEEHRGNTEKAERNCAAQQLRTRAIPKSTTRFLRVLAVHVN